MPHLITDHLWFWGHTEGSPSHPVHPAADAPRCLPCGYNTSLLAGLALPFDPPLACPFCTWQKLCAADVKRRSIYGDDCGFRPRYPPVRPGTGWRGAGCAVWMGSLPGGGWGSNASRVHSSQARAEGGAELVPAPQDRPQEQRQHVASHPNPSRDPAALRRQSSWRTAAAASSSAWD